MALYKHLQEIHILTLYLSKKKETKHNAKNVCGKSIKTQRFITTMLLFLYILPKSKDVHE